MRGLERRAFTASLVGMAQNPEEIFDVVNERDEVVGSATRREVHARGLMHRAVHVEVFDDAGRIFLQKRSMKKDMSPGLWDSSCSGHLDAGEDYDAAAIRELGEEIGVRPSTGSTGSRQAGSGQAASTSSGQAAPIRWFRIEACAETAQEFCWIYRLKHNGPFVLHPEEIDSGEWLAPDELTRRMAARPEDYCAALKLIWSRVTAGN